MDDPNAAPSAEVAAPTPETFTPEQRSKWLETGETPEPTKKEDAAPSTESGGENPNPPVTDDGKPNDTQPEQKPKKGAESRKQELAAEIQDYLTQRAQAKREAEEWQQKLDQLKQGVKAMDPPAATDKGANAPVKPKVDEFETYDAFEDARDKYFSDLAEYKAREAVRIDRETREKEASERAKADEQKKVADSWRAKTAEAKKAHADYEQVAFSKEIPITDAMQKFLLSSEAGADVLYKLGQNIPDAQRIAALSDVDTYRELTKLELSLSTKATPPTPKTITNSNPPPKEIGGFGKTPDDAVKSALESGDTRGYIDEMNRRDAARLQRK